MGALADSLFAVTDPVTTLIVLALGAYVRAVKDTLRRDIKQVRARVARIEDNYIAADGGRDVEPEGDDDV